MTDGHAQVTGTSTERPRSPEILGRLLDVESRPLSPGRVVGWAAVTDTCQVGGTDALPDPTECDILGVPSAKVGRDAVVRRADLAAPPRTPRPAERPCGR